MNEIDTITILVGMFLMFYGIFGEYWGGKEKTSITDELRVSGGIFLAGMIILFMGLN